MVLVSLALQVILVLTGGRRKYVASYRLTIFTWCAYLMADWVATFALDIISSNHGGGNELIVLWAPFLLMHLGGPETITAFSFADNELWIRHLVGVIIQTLITVYVIILSWQTTWLSFLSLPMLLVGTIKFGERSWVLRSASRDQFRYSSTEQRILTKFVRKHDLAHQLDLNRMHRPVSYSNLIRQGRGFFEVFKVLFVDLMLEVYHRDNIQKYFQKRFSSKDVFKVIEIELGYAYDTFYTKAPISYTRWGLFSRFLNSSLTIIVFVMFSVYIFTTSDKYSTVDMVITLVLIVGAIILEIYAFISSLSSDWTYLWLYEHSQTLLLKVISCLRFHQKDKSKWSKSTRQYNLLSFSLNQSRKTTGILGLIPWHNKRLVEMMENLRQLKVRTNVSDKLEDLICTHFIEKSLSGADAKLLCTFRGDSVLEKYGFLDELRWSTDVEFDHSILIWHVATDICYCSDASDSNSSYKEISKQLADYLLYLLVMCPFMFAIGIGIIRFQHSCYEAIKFYRSADELDFKIDKMAWLRNSIQEDDRLFSTQTNDDKSVLREASRLAKYLQEEISDKEKKWEMVSNVWVEMLGYAANQCSGLDHAENLAKGGELLTHVWFLMAHLGITERQYDI